MQSAAGPSALGKATGFVPKWKREGLSTICKQSNAREAQLFEAIAEDAYLSKHVPMINSVTKVATDRDSVAAGNVSFRAAAPADAPAAEPGDEMFEVRMQDLAAGMTRPCAMSILMGTRTIVPGSDTQEHLEALDHATSTASLGFRIDAARTVVGDALDTLPLPDGVSSLNDLKEEASVVSALETFFQADTSVCKAALLLLEEMSRALERSAFFAKHVLLRSSLLLVYDDAARTHVHFRMINFGFSYALPEGAPPLTHADKWDGKPESHEDGYLTGVRSLTRLMRALERELEIRDLN